MSLLTLEWSSAVLGKQTTARVLFPDVGEPPFPVLYLFHGLSDDSSIWLRRTRLEVYVAELPLIVVMPDGYRGFYTDHEEGPAYARHFGEELTAFVDRMFPTRADRSGRAVGGLSMGGYGALRIGLGYADRFCSIHSHSGAVGWSSTSGRRRSQACASRGPEFEAELTRIFGHNPKGSNHDPLALARKARAAKKLPAIQLDCGVDDYLLEDNRAFARSLTRAGIPHSYREYPGAHNWDYWDREIRTALVFHAAQLGIKTAVG